MGLILFDTTVFIDHLRRSVAAREAWRDAAAAGHDIRASVVTKTELLGGMRSHERQATGDLIDSMTWIEVTDDIADLAGTWARRYRRSQQGIGLLDYLIGATADLIGARLWTTNVRHFPMFRGLRAPY